MKNLLIPDRTSEWYVRCELLPRAGDIFRNASFRPSLCGQFDFYMATPIALSRSEQWELGFIPASEMSGTYTKGAFLYSAATDSLLGPFHAFFHEGHWEQYLANE